METPIQRIIELIIQPPGNLIYHLVLVFAVLSSLQAVLISRQHRPSPYAGRLIFGLLMLLAGQAILFISSGLAWQGIIDRNLVLPPLDRAVVVFSLIWIVWMWNFPLQAKLGDTVTGFLVLGVVLVFLFTLTGWSAQAAGQSFNGSLMDQTWELAGLVVVLTGMAILLFSRPPAWGYGFGMLSLSLAGLAAHTFLSAQQGDLSGYIRLGQLAAYPLLPALLHRYSAPAPQTGLAQDEATQAETLQDGAGNPAAGGSAAASSAAAPSAVAPSAVAAGIVAAGSRLLERRRYSASPRTVRAWLDLVEAQELESVQQNMVRALAHTMLADLCFLVRPPEFGYIALHSGYDLIREEAMEGSSLEQNALPALAYALQRSKPLRITSTDTPPADLAALAHTFGLKETGSLLFLPLVVNETIKGGILLLSPYSDRQWMVEDQTYLSSELEVVARILHGQGKPARVQGNVTQTAGMHNTELENLRRENQALLEEISALRSAAERLNGAGASGTAVTASPDLNALVALQQEAQEQITALQAENARLEEALRAGGATADETGAFEQVEKELRASLQELAILQNQLAEANARNLIMEREARAVGRTPTEDREVITSIVQEMRQPMSSILGYTDLLLAESVGILGALQRKFLERVKASTERMHTMLNDLIQVTAMNEDGSALLPQPVDLGSVIDDAMADTSAQLREKNIILRVDLPQAMPQIYADRDAIQQIILQLLQNAGAATPSEGSIVLRARMRKESDISYLLMQVTDSGGGIQPDDLDKVFVRRYRADMPLIQGLGDTGVGLSIARTLVEAHGGRIWVESDAPETTTFSVLLPVRPTQGGMAEQ
jgi:signal transduction histidine kinase